MAILIVLAFVWLAPILICLGMAIGSLISPRFRQYCVDHLLGPEAPAVPVTVPVNHGAMDRDEAPVTVQARQANLIRDNIFSFSAHLGNDGSWSICQPVPLGTLRAD